MPLFRKPFYRASRGLWYVEITRGKQTNLGKEKDAAFTRYHELMAQLAEPRASSSPSPSAPATIMVVVISDKFLDWCEKHRAADTYRWYKDRLQLFCNAIAATLSVCELKNFQVQEWVDSCPNLSPGSKRNHCRSVQRAMKWAVRQGVHRHLPGGAFGKARGRSARASGAAGRI